MSNREKAATRTAFASYRLVSQMVQLDPTWSAILITTYHYHSQDSEDPGLRLRLDLLRTLRPKGVDGS
jgi:hypothetical protein